MKSRAHSASTSRSSSLLIPLFVFMGIAALGLSLDAFLTVNGYGFPDGHTTEYEEATRVPLLVLGGGYGLLGMYSLTLPFLKMERRQKIRWILILATLLVSLFLVAAILMPWYFLHSLGLDNGQGG